jgi:quinoprotein glucose dehydrogenase
VTSPPAVVGNNIIVGSAVADNNRIDGASGEVRAYDARTGVWRWTWDPVPQASTDPAYATWIGPNAHRTGAANTWSVMAADPARDLVFLPTSSPSPDYFGGERLGDNRYANSVVALRASTGKLVWHFQVVHHDLWDYDNASPPALVTIRRNGVAIPAVIQGNKNGMLYVLDRRTGKPIFPIEERSVPASDVPGETASPTQPFTTFLPPLVPHMLTAADAFGADSTNRAWCANQFRTLRADGIYTPPSVRGTLTVPSNIGGAHWGGLVFDPASSQIIVPVNRLATLIRLVPREQYTDTMRRGNRTSEFAPMRGTPYALQREILRSPSGLPCTSPPYGELVAVSTRTGRVTWRIPLGGLGTLAGPNGPTALIGSPNLGGPIITASGLVFIAAALDSKLRAIDVATGAELWSGALPGGGKATPMTFRGKSGRQYVVIAAGGDNDVWPASDALVAFALPLTKR